MIRRVTRFVAKLSLVLLAGCLSGEDGPRALWPRPQHAPDVAAPPPAPAQAAPSPPVPPPDLASDYHARPAPPPPARQTSMALDPALTRARAEVKPTPAPPAEVKPAPTPPAELTPPPKPDPPLVAALRSALQKHP